jgi:hypothetical protein
MLGGTGMPVNVSGLVNTPTSKPRRSARLIAVRSGCFLLSGEPSRYSLSGLRMSLGGLCRTCSHINRPPMGHMEFIMLNLSVLDKSNRSFKSVGVAYESLREATSELSRFGHYGILGEDETAICIPEGVQVYQLKDENGFRYLRYLISRDEDDALEGIISSIQSLRLMDELRREN